MKFFAGAGCRRVSCDLHFLPEKVLLWTSNHFSVRGLALKRVHGKTEQQDGRAAAKIDHDDL